MTLQEISPTHTILERITDQNCAQVSFESLTADPFVAMKRIYSILGFDSFQEESESHYPLRLQEECYKLKDYKPNSFSSSLIDDKIISTIKCRWRKQFDRFGYDDDFKK